MVASGKGVKRGRGASFVRARNISGNWHHRQPGSHRVIVKQRSVRAAWKGGRGRAHLRYVQRDGTSRDGERGQGDATRARNGRVFYRRSLLATLRGREVARVGVEMAEAKALPFRTATDGENVSGKFTGTVQLSSGKFAVVEKSHEFTLVPWRPIIDRQLGREVMGVVQGGSVSWQLGRQRGLSL